MDYTPRYSQPFTLEQATLLDTAIITEEITRLQNSLSHLKKTQETLREYLTSAAAPDPEFTQAVTENEVVIGSQEERVGILKMALLHKGVSSHSAHYDTAPRDSDMGTGHQGSWALPNDIDHSSTQTAADEGDVDVSVKAFHRTYRLF